MKKPTVYYYIEKQGNARDRRAKVTVKVVNPDRSMVQDTANVDWDQLPMFNEQLFGEGSEALKGILAERDRS